jgi:L-fuconolactonase
MLRNAEVVHWIKGVVGWVPLQDPLATAKILAERYIPNLYFKGVRHLIHNEADPRWLLQDTVIRSLGVLADYDLPYDVVGILPAHIRTALEVAEQVPGLRMVFDHLNQPPMGAKAPIDGQLPMGGEAGGDFGEWGELMRAAASHRNFYVKISGLGTASGNPSGWTAADLEPCIEFVLKHFGEDRCFCGGDWPVCLLAGSYEKTWAAYRDILERLLGEEGRAKVLSRNAGDFYKL